MTICNYAFDNTPATQRFDSFQHFSMESLGMVGDHVSLDSIGTSPHEIAEWASTTGHVYVSHMTFELLNPPEVFVTKCTGRACPAAHSTISPVVCGALEDEVLSSVMWWKIWLQTHLKPKIPNMPRSDLHARRWRISRLLTVWCNGVLTGSYPGTGIASRIGLPAESLVNPELSRGTDADSSPDSGGIIQGSSMAL
jgi:hypothetical protein